MSSKGNSSNNPDNNDRVLNMLCNEHSKKGIVCNCSHEPLEADTDENRPTAAEALELARWYQEQRQQMAQRRGKDQARMYRKPKVRDRPAA